MIAHILVTAHTLVIPAMHTLAKLVPIMLLLILLLSLLISNDFSKLDFLGASDEMKMTRIYPLSQKKNKKHVNVT